MNIFNCFVAEQGMMNTCMFRALINFHLKKTEKRILELKLKARQCITG